MTETGESEQDRTTLTLIRTRNSIGKNPQMAAELLHQPPPADRQSAAAPPPIAELGSVTAAASLLPTQSGAGHPRPAQKRQRRPSVRLGEIGDDPHHHPVPIRRPKPHPSSKSMKARSMVHLVNGNDAVESFEVENGDIGTELGQRRKAKRGGTKKARSSWVSKVEDFVEEKEEEEHDDYRDFERDSDSQLKVHESPIPSFENERWGNKSTGREGVRSWLIELGLSRYSSVFEVHEVDDEVLPFLTLEDLKDMGITAVGSRRKLYSAIQKLRKGYS